MTRRERHYTRYSAMLGWHDADTYEEVFEAFCWRYHPAVASILAHDFLVSREAGLKAHDTQRARRKEAA